MTKIFGFATDDLRICELVEESNSSRIQTHLRRGIIQRCLKHGSSRCLILTTVHARYPFSRFKVRSFEQSGTEPRSIVVAMSHCE